MTLDEMFDEMELYGFEDFEDSQKLSLINEAYLDLVTREPWPFMEKVLEFKVPSGVTQITSNGVFGVDVATNTHTLSYVPAQVQQGLVVEYRVSSVLSFTDQTNSIVLVPERADMVEKSYRPLNMTYNPTRYYFVGEDLFVYPEFKGDTMVRLYFVQTPVTTTVDEGTDVFLLPARHHSLVVYGALIKAFLVNDDPQAAIFQNMFESRYQQMRNDIWMRQYDRPDTVHVITDSYDWSY